MLQWPFTPVYVYNQAHVRLPFQEILMTDNAQPQPFKIAVGDETLDWIKQRVQSARVIPDVQQPEGKEWNDGVPSSVISELVEYWKTCFDWRKVEAKLNATYNMFTVDIAEGDEVINLHFVHHRSERAGAIPLLFAHGWPGNFTEVCYCTFRSL